MKAYSQDMREHILQAVDRGIPKTEVARIFGVGCATVLRYERQRRELGTLSPKKIPGRPSRKGALLLKVLPAQLEARPDATLEEHRRLFLAKTGMDVSVATIARAIERLGWTLKKKTLRAGERNEEAHAAWHLTAKTLDPAELVFVDECGISTAMTPLYSRSPKGQRAVGKVPRARWRNVTLIASLSLQGITSSMTLDGPADSAAFEAYVRHALVPALEPGQTVILDNISIHKGRTVREAVEGKRCDLLFLPPYSEGLSPVDEAFSKIKQDLRRAQARTPQGLDTALRRALDTVRPADALGWFTHCGYPPTSRHL